MGQASHIIPILNSIFFALAVFIPCVSIRKAAFKAANAEA